MLKDDFGAYDMTFRYVEPGNSKIYEMRKYVNSKKIKSLGGMYAIYCEEDNKIIFRKSEYLRDRSYGKFVDGKCEDAKNADSSAGTPMCKSVDCKYDSKIISQYVNWARNAYHLPDYIDKSKLTEEEFSELRRLVKKGLPKG